jgi:hypothetical protein
MSSFMFVLVCSGITVDCGLCPGPARASKRTWPTVAKLQKRKREEDSGFVFCQHRDTDCRHHSPVLREVLTRLFSCAEVNRAFAETLHA